MSTLVPPTLAVLNVARSHRRNILPSSLQTTAHFLNLPLDRLSAYEPVTTQFQDYGVLMQHVLALIPSNAAFVDYPQQLFLMPSGNRNQLSCLLQYSPIAIEIGLRGYRDIQVSGLDHNDHRLSSALFIPPRSEAYTKAPRGKVVINPVTARQVIVSSPGPFLIENICICFDQDDIGKTLTYPQDQDIREKSV